MELNDDADRDLERSYLDMAIYISLNILELVIYYRSIEGKDMPISNRDTEEVDRGNWEQFLLSSNREAL